MIQINLLPHREWARKKRRERFYAQVGLSAAIGGVIAVLVYGTFQWQLDQQTSRNLLLRQEIAQLDLQIKDIAGLQAQLNALKSRQAGVESLQADRNLPVHLLDELVKQLPEGVYLRSMRQEGMTINLTGVAQSQERVSELLRNFGTQSPWLSQPQLVEIVAGTVTLERNQPRRAYNFSVRLTLTKGKT
jgi:type IV pilus assembly protein PilN